jgi:hypothetical protein
MSMPGGGWTNDMISAMKGTSQVFADGSASFVTPDDNKPLTNNWNFTISHPTVWNSFVEISYVGNSSSHMLNPGNSQSINLIPIGGYYNKAFPTPVVDSGHPLPSLSALYGPYIDYYRPYSWYGEGLTGTKMNAWSNYHAVQLAWNKTKGWANWGLNYTFSKALGVFTDADPSNLQNDYGPLNIDRTHVVNASYSFDLGTRVRGEFPGSRLVKGLTNGWQLSGITTWQSGVPLQAISNSNFGFGNAGPTIQNTDNYKATGSVSDYIPNQLLSSVQMTNVNVLGTPDIALQPWITAACSPTAGNGHSGSYMNTSCWSIPNFLQNGPLYKGYFHSPAYFDSDLTMAKSFHVAEKKTLQIRMSGFNFLNHPLWSFNSSNWDSISLGDLATPNGGFTPGQMLHPLDFNKNKNGDVTYVGRPHSKYGRRTVMLGAKFEF